MAEVIRSALLGGMPHGFLDAAQSDAGQFDLVAHRAGPVFVRQTHSAIALAVAAPFAGDLPEADGLASATPGLALAIRTADCAPVLLADVAGGVVGAAHAGWRGAFGGVLEATVAAMVGLGARRHQISAVIGPTIAQPSYQVDEAFRERLIRADPGNATLFAQDNVAHRENGTRHYRFDLPAYVRKRLLAAGIEAVEDLGLDTYADPARFHSFRRSTHRGEVDAGRQYALIALPS